MKLEALTDELRVLAEKPGGASPRLSPDAFKRKWGRCPTGFNSHPETGRCTPVSQLKSPVAVHQFKPVAKPKSPVTKAAPAQTEPTKAAAEPSDTPEVRKERSFLKRALHGVWHVISDPFKKAWKLATDKKYRTEVKDFVIRAAKKEGSQTKVMAGTFKRILKGEKVSREEKVAAMNQFIDLAKVATVGGIAKHMAAGGVMKFLSTMASPVDEVVGVAVDKPLRKITKKLFGHAHGILPSSFYEESVSLVEAYKEGDEYKLIETMVDALMDEMGKTDLSDDDVMAALMKSGLRAKKKGLIQKIIGALSGKKESVLVQSMRDLLGEAS